MVNGSIIFPSCAIYPNGAVVEIRDTTLTSLRDFYARKVRTGYQVYYEPVAAPLDDVAGVVWYNSGTNKLMVREAAASRTVTTT